jgi:hypothetical protein
VNIHNIDGQWMICFKLVNFDELEEVHQEENIQSWFDHAWDTIIDQIDDVFRERNGVWLENTGITDYRIEVWHGNIQVRSIQFGETEYTGWAMHWHLNNDHRLDMYEELLSRYSALVHDETEHLTREMAVEVLRKQIYNPADGRGYAVPSPND